MSSAVPLVEDSAGNPTPPGGSLRASLRESIRSRGNHGGSALLASSDEISTTTPILTTAELDAPPSQKFVEPPARIVEMRNHAPPAAVPKWGQPFPYPRESADNRGDSATLCGDMPGNLLGLVASGVVWAYYRIQHKDRNTVASEGGHSLRSSR